MEILSPAFKDNDLIVTVGNHMLENGKSVEVSQLSRLHMAEALAAEAANGKAQQPAAGQDGQPEQQPAAGQPQQAGSAESGDKAQ